MVICKYFPSCRFGNSCKFDHVYPSSQFSRGNTQQYFANSSYYQHGNKPLGPQNIGNTMEVADVMRVVVQEITQAENGSQWPLSCFSPIKECQCFPGMMDYSPEEIRWKMYEANKNGTLAECQRQVKELNETAKQKRSYLKNPNAEIYAIIEKCYGSKADGSSAFSADSSKLQSNTFGFSTHSYGNNQQNAQTPISNANFKFSLPQLQTGNTIPQPQGILGGGNTFQTSQIVSNKPSIFGGSTSASQGFGSISQNIPALQTTAQNVFGMTMTGNVFGSIDATQAQSANVFGAVQTKSGSVFGGVGASQTQLNSIFGGGGTAQTQQVSVFGGGNARAASPQGVFGEGIVTSPTSNKIFGRSDTTPMPNTGAFGSSESVSTNSTFGTMSSVITPSGSVFGSGSTIPGSSSTFGQSNVFGSSAVLSTPQSNVLDTCMYTLKEELSQDELLAFSANTFTLGRVPTRPPPKELCY